VLRIEGISVSYGGLRALNAVSLEIAAGEFVAVVGPSGCGKSTLLRVVGGLLAPSTGRVAVFGSHPHEAQRRKRLGLVLQEPALLPWRSVAGNIRLPLEVNRDAGVAPPGAATVARLIDLVGLAAFRTTRPGALSGGMQQRVALARALAINPDLLLMDEPFAALDEITRESLRYELLRIWAATAATDGAPAARKTVLFVTHSVPEAVVLADRVVVLSRRPGRVRADLRIDLPRPRTPAVERLPAFLDAVDAVRRVLRENLPREAALA